ncbi:MULTISPECIES: hypothetical protein [unclassified Nocardioides]|uniref:hypothetical protein n=1 Tax=unclassified Nocardioides TaxID=2615069 RepID=UPI0009F149EC|nr:MULTISPECIES: hypothetical protein [unclassified Nocardioides]GAW50459.1 uncharacterized protein (Precursor) [Nocardioides sp. PD653-B2]GAW53898.1 uncharacterized protein (Precursor) [Nocardioides sp. PD653]
MLLGLCLITVTCLGWAIAATATRPADHATRRRDLDRRFRQLRQHPDRVNRLDVENLLLADSIPAATVERVTRHADSRRIGARTMWRWADRYGTDKVVLVIDADLAEDTLLDHLDAGTAPDWQSLYVFASLSQDTLPAGMPRDELLDLDAVPAYADLTLADLDDWETSTVEPGELRRFESLPPIADPGLTPFSPIDASNPDDDHDDWPSAA